MNRRKFITGAATSVVGLSLPRGFSDPAATFNWDLEEQKRIINIFRGRIKNINTNIVDFKNYYFIINGCYDHQWIGRSGKNPFYMSSPNQMCINCPNDLGITEGYVDVAIFSKNRYIIAKDFVKSLGIGHAKITIPFNIDSVTVNGNEKTKNKNLIINNLEWNLKKFWENKKIDQTIDRCQKIFFDIYGSDEKPPLELSNSMEIV